MRNIDATTITPAFLQRLNDCADPRLKQMLGALVTHLHDFAREVKLTEAEWMQGIQFLTADRPEMQRHAAGVHPAVGHARACRCWWWR